MERSRSSQCRGSATHPETLRRGRGRPYLYSVGQSFAAAARETAMNYLRTAMLLAGLTALFMGVGYLIGGATGAMIALVIAAATNLFTYWNSDRMVLSIY